MRCLIPFLSAILLSGCAGLETVKETYYGIADYFGGRDNAEPPRELEPLEPKLKLNILWDEASARVTTSNM
jgi:outer membrane protein assembly factor BamB